MITDSGSRRQSVILVVWSKRAAEVRMARYPPFCGAGVLTGLGLSAPVGGP
jgi:hypothetical protein